MVFCTKAVPSPILFNDLNLPWWEECWPHLGHLFNKDQLPHHDLLKKKSQFIGKLHSFRQEFGNLDPIVYTKLVSIYLSSFYGSNLWDLYDDISEKLFKTWNSMIRMNFKIPRETHRYFVGPISESSHLKVKLVKNFINFATNLSRCDKPHINYLQHIQKCDFRSVFGRNYQNICAEAGSEQIETVILSDIEYCAVPAEEEYRISLVSELLEMRAGRLETELTADEINTMINLLCID